MSTAGINPIQLGLRDLGQGFGNLLSDEAKRRQDALLAQQQQGQLSLAQAQLRNQAEVAAAEGQVSLAKVGAEGRYQDQTVALKRQEIKQTGDYQTEHNRIAAATQQATDAHLKRSDNTAALTQSSLDIYHKANIKFQNDQLDAHKPVWDAQGREAKARAEALEGDAPQDFSGWINAMTTDAASRIGPEDANAAKQVAQGAAEALVPGWMARYPKDAQGRIMIRPTQARELLGVLSPFIKARNPDALTASERQKAIHDGAKIIIDGNPGIPPEHAWTRAEALVTRSRDYTTRLQGVSQQVKVRELDFTNQALKNNGGTEPTLPEVQQFLASYAQSHNGAAPRMDPRPGFQGLPDADLPEWQTFRNQALLKSGAKPPTEAQGKSIQKQIESYQQQHHLKAATDLLGGMAKVPASPDSVPPLLATAPGFQKLSPAMQTTIVAASQREAARIGRPVGELFAIMEVEANYNPEAKNPKSSAAGLMQLIKSTADRYKVDPTSVPDNIRGGAEDWARALKAANGDPREAYHSYYNAEKDSAKTQRFMDAMKRHVPTTGDREASAPATSPPPTASPRVLHVGTPEYVVFQYRRRAISQPQALDTLLHSHGLSLPQAQALLYTTPGAAVTDSIRGRQTPPLSEEDIRAAVAGGKIDRATGERLLRTRAQPTSAPQPSLAAVAQPVSQGAPPATSAPPQAAPAMGTPSLAQAAQASSPASGLPESQMLALRDTIYSTLGPNPQNGTYPVEWSGKRLNVTIQNGVIIGIAPA